MSIANFIADILGILLVVIPFSLFINHQQMKNMFSALENEFFMYMNGLALFVTGIVIALLHNIWVWNWVIIVTIAGWLFIIKGLFLMFFTKDAVELIGKLKATKYIPYLLLVVLFLGLKFLYFGFIGK